MKHFKLMAVVALTTTANYPCIVKDIINDSEIADIFIHRVHIKGLKGDDKGVTIVRRLENMDKPRVINANVDVGEYLHLTVTEKSSYGQICKDYRIFPDEKNEKILLQKKDGCRRDWLTYETILELPMDPESCFLEIRLEGDANGLNIRTVRGNDESANSIKEKVL
jgi:hypothetical protein